MSRYLLIGTAAALASCAAPPPPQARSPGDALRSQYLLAGKSAVSQASCLPSVGSNDMIVIDENTVAFRQSAARIYVAHMTGGCPMLGRPGYALLTRPFGSGQLCRGDMGQVIDTASGAIVGTCVFGDFTLYARPGS